MNMETEKAVAALGGAGTNEGIDYKSEFEKLQKQYQSEKVEAGRLKKANEELAHLRKENEELKKTKRTSAALESLDDSLKEDIPDDYQRGIAQIAQATVDDSMSNTNARLAQLEAERDADNKRRQEAAQRNFVGQIESSFPGFLASIGTGGDKQAAWIKYQKNNAETISSAIARCDNEVLSYHIRNFYDSLGFSAPSGSQDEEFATPDPRSFGGGSSQNFDAGNKKFYTAAEYESIMEKAQADHFAHRISYQEYSKICEEMSNAFKQGRVKQQ